MARTVQVPQAIITIITIISNRLQLRQKDPYTSKSSFGESVLFKVHIFHFAYLNIRHSKMSRMDSPSPRAAMAGTVARVRGPELSGKREREREGNLFLTFSVQGSDFVCPRKMVFDLHEVLWVLDSRYGESQLGQEVNPSRFQRKEAF